jgi:TonB family protein
MRIVPVLFGALLITVAVFLFMRSLIQYTESEGTQLAVYNDVQILHSVAEPETPPPPEQTQVQKPEVTAEPTLEPLATAAPALAAPSVPAAALQIPALDLGAGDLDIPAVGDRWSGGVGDRWAKALAGAEGVQVGGAGGTDAQGYVEVVPYDTRRPNVPEVAWRNKIDGWVLVAFSVTKDGHTQKVRVLDANPRGVFEDTVIAAVSDWRYRVSFAGKAKGDVVMTQKVEVRWSNYPQNLPNVD